MPQQIEPVCSISRDQYPELIREAEQREMVARQVQRSKRRWYREIYGVEAPPGWGRPY